LQDEAEQQRERFLPAALICSVIANVNRDPERRPNPWEPRDFMPGARTEEDEMREFAEAVGRGETFETDPEDIERFKRQMEATFGRRETGTGMSVGNLIVTTPVRTNAIAGDTPRRGLN
jgi:hypothetical protein